MFDTALIESAAHPAGIHGRHAKTLTIAVAFHSAVIGALVLSGLVSAGEPPEPAIPIVFPAFPGGPPPPPPGDATPIQASFETRVRTDEAVPIVRMPELPETTSIEPVRETSATNVGVNGEPGAGTGGDGGPGVPGGVENGIPGGTGSQEDGDGIDTDRIIDAHADGVTPPTLISKVDPSYPEALRKLRLEGVVILEAVITAAGTVDQVRVVSSPNLLFDAGVLAAVRQWRYAPGTLNGRTVAVRLTVTVRFALNA